MAQNQSAAIMREALSRIYGNGETIEAEPRRRGQTSLHVGMSPATRCA
jgi:hypothetical protein